MLFRPFSVQYCVKSYRHYYYISAVYNILQKLKQLLYEKGKEEGHRTKFLNTTIPLKSPWE